MSNKYPTEPVVRVGVLTAQEIDVDLQGVYTADGEAVTGPQHLTLSPDNKVVWNGRQYDRLLFKASSDSCVFEIKDVVIGVNFHWERKENQRFVGDLEFLYENGLVAVDIVPVED
ncbi:MAG: amidase, partial [Muribaculaceae bacterium]|nr:amidase [Muribaculaceae bacterium]